MPRRPTVQERDKYGDVITYCDWCGEVITDHIRTSNRSYCSKDCRDAANYGSNIAFAVAILVIGMLGVFSAIALSIAMPSESTKYLQMAAILPIVLSIVIIIMARAIIRGHRLHKVANEDTFW